MSVYKNKLSLSFNHARCVFVVRGIWFLSGVELIVMNLYSLDVNGRTVCEVEIEAPAWLPVRPRVPKVWLSSVISRAFDRYFLPQPPYLGYDRSTGCTFLN